MRFHKEIDPRILSHKERLKRHIDTFVALFSKTSFAPKFHYKDASPLCRSRWTSAVQNPITKHSFVNLWKLLQMSAEVSALYMVNSMKFRCIFSRSNSACGRPREFQSNTFITGLRRRTRSRATSPCESSSDTRNLRRWGQWSRGLKLLMEPWSSNAECVAISNADRWQKDYTTYRYIFRFQCCRLISKNEMPENYTYQNSSFRRFTCLRPASLASLTINLISLQKSIWWNCVSNVLWNYCCHYVPWHLSVVVVV